MLLLIAPLTRVPLALVSQQMTSRVQPSSADGSRRASKWWSAIGRDTNDFSMVVVPTLETTQGQMDGFLSQLPYKYHLEEVTSVGD